MTRPPTMSRRQLLGGAAVLVAAGVPSLGRLLLGGVTPASDELAGRLRALVDGDAVRTVGRAHAATLPASTTATGLALDLLPPGLSPERARQLPLDELRHHIAAAVRHDYRSGRVEAVDGWLLSATEARLCALHVLR